MTCEKFFPLTADRIRLNELEKDFMDIVKVFVRKYPFMNEDELRQKIFDSSNIDLYDDPIMMLLYIHTYRGIKKSMIHALCKMCIEKNM